MPIPPAVAWVVPVFVPFIIGLLVGLILKRTVKLLFTVAALVIILVVMGYLSLSFRDLYDRAMEFLPKLVETGEGIKDVLPYSSVTFLVGLALGLWRG